MKKGTRVRVLRTNEIALSPKNDSSGKEEK